MTSDAFNHIWDLCRDGVSSESELISQLKSVLRTNPEVLNEQHHQQTLLHLAVKKRSVEFIKVLVETDEGLVRMAFHSGLLPIHAACSYCHVEAVKYLLSIYPESISIADNYGFYPLHCVMYNFGASDDDLKDLVRFLLKNDQGAVSQPITHHGLALHLACKRQSLEIIKLVYNKYPQAIHARDNDGKTPLDVCNYDGDTRIFLEAQLEWESQAREQTQPDENGQLPVHRFLLESPDVHVGTVELVISSNPDSVRARDNTGCNPLHYACKFGQLDIVKFLMDSNEDCPKEVTSSGELPLHIACREGKCSVINCILERSDHGVSLCNNDGKLPLELYLLFCEHDVDRDSLIYVEAVNRLLRAHPNVLEGLAANACALKRKHGSI